VVAESPANPRWLTAVAHSVSHMARVGLRHCSGGSRLELDRNDSGPSWIKAPWVAGVHTGACRSRTFLPARIGSRRVPFVVVEDNRTNFSLLQADLASGRKHRMALDRKAVLEILCKEFRPPVFCSRHFNVDPEEMFESAKRMSLEGIISKKRDAPYRSDRTESGRRRADCC
jgi:hypothetical protein